MTLVRRDPARIAARAAADLVAAKAAAISEINAATGLARQTFITTCPGQEMIYIAKEREALAFLAAPTVDLTAYLCSPQKSA